MLVVYIISCSKANSVEVDFLSGNLILELPVHTKLECMGDWKISGWGNLEHRLFSTFLRVSCERKKVNSV